MFKLFFWVVLIGGGVFVGGQVMPVYYNNMKIDNVFKGAVQDASLAESKVKGIIAKQLRVQSIDLEALPEDFFENISINKEDEKLQVGAEYHITLWLLGEPTVDPESEYLESEVEPMDKLKLRARLDFDFSPYQETP